MQLRLLFARFIWQPPHYLWSTLKFARMCFFSLPESPHRINIVSTVFAMFMARVMTFICVHFVEKTTQNRKVICNSNLRVNMVPKGKKILGQVRQLSHIGKF